MRLFVLVLSFLFAATSAQSGAWAREKGVLFVSSGGNFLLSEGAQLPVYYDPTIYAEYGLTDTMTIGADYYTADQGRIGTGFIFARIPLGDAAGQSRYAFSLGFGARMDPLNPMEKLMRAGLSWGRSLDNGYVAVDTAAIFSTIDRTARPKIDITWGLHLSEHWSSGLQLQLGQGYSNDHYAKINPSVSYAFTDDIRISVGAVKALTGDEGSALRVDLWTTF